MNIKDWIAEKGFALHRIETLVFLIVSSSLVMMTAVIPFIKDYTINPIIHFLFWGLVEAIIISYWYYNRSIFPKKGTSKMSIVLAIITENAKQKTRITNDFASQIQKRLRDLQLDNSYEIIVLHNHLSRITQNRIHLYNQSIKADIKSSEDIQAFNKLTKRLNAKLIIYGDLIKRNPENSTYCLSLDATLLHKPTDVESGQRLHQEFITLWKREIIFLEKEELTGFKINAEQIFFTTSYMIGLATFVDNNYIQGIKIWEALEHYLKDKAELAEYANKILILKSTSFLLQSRILFFNGHFEEAITYRNKYLSLTPNEYDKYLNEAMNQVKLRNDAELALDFVSMAEKIAPANDGTWRYSKFYLLIKLSRCKEALTTFDDILKFKYNTEIDTINQVISYNTSCLKQDKSHIQTNFIIGVLLYKKINLPIPAYEKLELFINSQEICESWKPLKERAEQYLREIDKMIGVK
ncbi:MAG: hypothetical protein HYU68_13000 [Bacteroidetes bacterium]|nr:hypothetical protein [Bacteroidota bacterium]